MGLKTRIGKRLLSLLLTVVMFFTAQGIPVWAETVDNNISLKSVGAESPADPVHYCTKRNDGSDYTDWSYVYFGSYPQTEVTGDALTAAIIEADYDTYGDTWIDGTKYRRISKSDTNDDWYFGDSKYRYFKWERIKWRVLKNDGVMLFVVADQGIDCKDYNEEYTSVTWEKCTLRKWLDDSFYNTAFSSGERGAIMQQNVVNEDNPWHDVEGGVDTKDKICLLSIGEVTDPEYGFCESVDTESISRRLQVSDYGHTMGSNSDTGGKENCAWWLRSPGHDTSYAASVYYDGSVPTDYGSGVSYASHAVVPALHINLASDLWYMKDDGTSGEGGEDRIETTYTLTFNSQGGSEVANQSVKEGEAALKPVNPTRKGYTFAGWYTDVACTEEYNFNNKVIGNITLYAKWTTDNQGGGEKNKCGDNLIWTLDGDGTLTISGTGEMYDFSINTVPWKSEGQNIKSVVIEEGVTSIGDYAFYGCSSLKEIVIPNGVTSIGECLFVGCSNLKEIVIPNGVTSIGNATFSECSSLRKIVIPDGVTSIGGYAFHGCSSLKEIVIPNGVTSIGERAFTLCSSLTEIVIPKGITSIEASVFDECSSLKKIVIPSGVTNIGANAFSKCSSLTKIVIPEGVTDIGNAAFALCSNLTEITIPKSVTSVADYVFLDCSSLSDIYYGGTQAQWEMLDVINSSEIPDEQNVVIHCQSDMPDYKDISNCTIALSNDYFTYTGYLVRPDVIVTDNGFTLMLDKDYIIEGYYNNIAAGEAKIIIKGIGKYTGIQMIPFTIEKAEPILKFASTNVNKTLGDAAFTNKLTVSTDGTLTYTSSNPSVATVNKSSGLVTLKGTGTATITANAEEGENYTAKSESYELTVEQPAFVDLSSLTYSFGNSWNAFSYSSSYQIPLSSYQMVFSDVKARELYNKYKKKWGGSCFGMSVTSGIFNLKGSSMVVEDFNATANEVSDLKVSDINENLNVDLRSWIEAMHVSWHDPGIQKCWSNNVGSGSLDRMCETVKNGIPVVVYISGSGGAHAVVGYKVERKSSKETYLYVYDPNFPKKIRYLSLKTNSEGDCLGWYYHENDREDWGSDYNGKISFITPDYYYGVWEASPGINQSARLSGNMAAAQADQPESSSDDINMLIANSEDFIIYDDEGNTIAKVQDGQLFSDNTDIYQYQPLDPVAGDENILIYLPTDAYLIQNTDDSIDKLEMDMVNNDQRACVVTSADDIAFHVDDSKELNTVSIQADDGDSYEILLDSSLENAKNMEEIIVSGTATRNTIEVGMTKEGCMLKNCGEAKVKINGEELGSATGSNQTDISKMEASLEYASCVYDGKNKEPEVVLQDGSSVLKNGTDYVVVYSNNIEPGTATATVYGIGRYTGTVKKNFTIAKRGEGSGENISKVNIAQATITLSQNSYTYDGWQKKPLVTVKLNGKILKVDTDYMVIYSNNINIGTAKVIIIGKRNYTGNKSVNFTIVKASEGMDASITCKKTVYKVTYGAKPFKINATSKSTMSFISSNSKIATVDKNTGKVTIKGTGVVTITVKAGKNSVKVTVKVSPKKQSLKSVKASKGRKLAVKWAKDKNATGYQVQISEDKNFRKIAKQKNVTKNSYSFTKLKAGKKYYVRIRSYKKSGKETLYGAWSKVKRSGKVRK